MTPAGRTHTATSHNDESPGSRHIESRKRSTGAGSRFGLGSSTWRRNESNARAARDPPPNGATSLNSPGGHGTFRTRHVAMGLLTPRFAPAVATPNPTGARAPGWRRARIRTTVTTMASTPTADHRNRRLLRWWEGKVTNGYGQGEAATSTTRITSWLVSAQQAFTCYPRTVQADVTSLGGAARCARIGYS